MLKRKWNLAAMIIAAQFSFTCLGTTNTCIAEDWPQWRGPRGDGVSTAKNVATKWSKTENVAWRAPLPGQGGATPAIWGDKIFVTSADGDALVVLCFSAKDGQQLWRTQVATGNQDARAGEGNSASPSPSTDGKHVWVFFSTGILACLDVDGKEVWKFDVGERFGKLDIQFGMTSTPVLDGDHLYLQLIHGPMRRDDDTRTAKSSSLKKRPAKPCGKLTALRTLISNASTRTLRPSSIVMTNVLSWSFTVPTAPRVTRYKMGKRSGVLAS